MNSTFLTVNQNILLNNTYYKWLIYIMNLQYQLNQSKSKDFLQISDTLLSLINVGSGKNIKT